MKYQIILALLLVTPTLAAAADIQCSFTPIEGEDDYGTIQVFMGKDGKVNRLIAKRPIIGKAKAYDFDFQEKDSTFIHVSKERPEVVEAKNKSGDRVVLKINDHSYSGWLGSSGFFYAKGKMLANPGDQSGSCAGKIMYPDERRKAMEEEMEKERKAQEQEDADSAN